MNPFDALDFLDTIAGNAHMTRLEHVRARHAYEVLKTALHEVIADDKDDADARPE